MQGILLYTETHYISSHLTSNHLEIISKNISGHCGQYHIFDNHISNNNNITETKLIYLTHA